ncbi:MAG: zinc-dependent dehydrogenase [Spirochaetes bacterium]|nr:zinc-dependent dehydrogenase [Spirochaetota bacterium]
MHTAKAARYYGGSDIRIETVELPEIKEGEIKVRVKACGICGSDISDWYMEPRVPTYFGHEPSGDVVEVGKNVKGLKEGDRVFAHHHVPCFVCHYCRRGYYTLCRTFKESAFFPGGFADHIVVPKLNVERDTLLLPEGMSHDEGTLIEPVACCIKGIKRANIHIGDAIAVIGAGFMGLVHVQLARMFGAGKVIVVDSVPYRLEKAKELGSDHTINFKEEEVAGKFKDLNEGRGADVVILCTGQINALQEAMATAEKGSTVYIFAPFTPDVFFPIDLNRFFFSEFTVYTSYSASPIETREALTLISGKRIDTKKLITHRYPLERIGEALELVKTAKESLKVIVTA